MDSEEIIEATGRFLAHERARLWIAELVLASELEPQMVLQAFGKLFNMDAIKRSIDNAAHASLQALSEAIRIEAETRELHGTVYEALEKTEKDIDALRFEVERLHDRLTEAAKLAGKLRESLPHTNGRKT